MNRIIININKNIIISLLIVIIVLAIKVGTSYSINNKTPDYLKKQVIDNISFENANVTYEDNVSTFTVEVYNKTNTDYNLKTITMIFTDDNGKTSNLIGYVGEKINANDGKYLVASIDKDISNSKSLQYIINK
jgi:hypothetical protein